MGLVASFTADETEERQFDRSLAFNRPTDMLMCGVVPGASSLVDANFHCTDDSGKTNVLKGVLNVIDQHDKLRRKLQPDETLDEDHVRGLNMLTDEMMALLCELPLKIEGDQAADLYCFPGGISSSPMTSDAWFDTFTGRVMDDLRWHQDDLRRASRQMEEMRYRTPVPGDINRLSYCQRLYDETTVWLLSEGFGEHYDSQTYYVHLVAAHCLMSHDAWESTLACFRNPRAYDPTEDNHVWDEEDNRRKAENAPPDKKVEICGRSFYWKGEKPPVELQLEALALMYLEESRSREGGYENDYLELLHSSRGPVLNEKTWLIMMLRSFAWSILTTRRKSSGSGQAMPSSCWDSQRPVWMI
jgi:hypothetical protein